MVFEAQPSDLATRPEFGPCARILLVEDEEILLLAVAKMLRKRGFIVLTAANGKDALDLLRMHKESISLLFLDVTFPACRVVKCWRKLAASDPTYQ